jgi:hypothetical protein
MTTCIFCANKLDSSDEHIIPESLNGRLHSKKLICSVCNSKVFGKRIDVALSNLFKPLIHILNLRNARTVIVEDPTGRKYLKKPDKIGLTPVAPEVTILKEEGITHITISGDPKNVAKLFKKRVKSFLQYGTPAKINVFDDKSGSLPLSADFELNIDNRINLAVNKIALEFYALNNSDISPIQNQLRKVSRLDRVHNVTYCNFANEVRRFEEGEISHLIIVKSLKDRRLLFGYVELFNLICAVVVLNDNYEGPEINYIYHQDALTGERLSREIAINIESLKLTDNSANLANDALNNLSNSVFDRLRDRQLQKSLAASMNRIKEHLEKEFPGNKVQSEEYSEKVHLFIAQAIAKLIIYDFPYSVSDLTEEQRHQINYIHSSINEDLYEAFCKANQNIIGMQFALNDRDLTRYFKLESFYKVPLTKWNDKKIVKIYCVLKEEKTADVEYYPFRVIFDSIRETQIK